MMHGLIKHQKGIIKSCRKSLGQFNKWGLYKFLNSSWNHYQINSYYGDGSDPVPQMTGLSFCSGILEDQTCSLLLIGLGLVSWASIALLKPMQFSCFMMCLTLLDNILMALSIDWELLWLADSIDQSWPHFFAYYDSCLLKNYKHGLGKKCVDPALKFTLTSSLRVAALTTGSRA